MAESAVPFLLGWRELAVPTPATMAWLGVVAVCGLVAHYCMARAFALADTLVVAPMDFLRLPLIAGIGWLVYNEPLDVWVMVGGAIIAVGNLANILGERLGATKS